MSVKYRYEGNKLVPLTPKPDRVDDDSGRSSALVKLNNVGELVPAADGAGTLVALPPSAAPDKQILDEDDYQNTLASIIERDFFPDLPRLRLKAAWLEARRRGDLTALVRLRDAASQLDDPDTVADRQARKRNRVPDTPLGKTPSDLNTPLLHLQPSGAATGEQEKKQRTRGAASTAVVAASASTGGDDDPVFKKPRLPTLTEFGAKFTSEDDASFAALMEHSQRKHREQYAWAHATAQHNQKLIEQADSASGAPKPWRYRVKNALMYLPEGAAPAQDPAPNKKAVLANARFRRTAAEATEDLRIEREMVQAPMSSTGRVRNAATEAADQLIRDKETRARRRHQQERGGGSPSNNDRQDGYDMADLAALRRARDAASHVGLDGLVEGEGGPDARVAGYSFVESTPDLRPGVDVAPIMTYGDVASTPLRILDGPEDIEEAVVGGPQFRVADTPQRDQLALDLADKAAAKRRQKQQSHHHTRDTKFQLPGARGATPRSGGASSARGRTPGDGWTPTHSVHGPDRGGGATPFAGAMSAGRHTPHTAASGLSSAGQAFLDAQRRRIGVAGSHRPGSGPILPSQSPLTTPGRFKSFPSPFI